MDTSGQTVALLAVRIGRRAFALPLETVIETMRPLPVRAISGSPPALLGIAVIRGEPTAVIDGAHLFAEPTGTHTRFVTLRVADRVLALAVGEVLGVRRIAQATLRAAPPLAAQPAIEAIGTIDADLVVVLRAGHVLPDALLADVDEVIA